MGEKSEPGEQPSEAVQPSEGVRPSDKETVRSAPELIEEQRRPIGEMLVASGAASRLDVASALQQQLEGDERRLGTILLDRGMAAPVAINDAIRSQAPPPGAASGTVRVDVDLLDSLLNLVGELTLARNELDRGVAETGDPATVRSARRLKLIASELQEGIMKTRMRPIGQSWSTLPRLVRDLGKAMGKRVKLVLEGHGTELDRNLLETLKDPLAELVRDAVHGVEPPARRAAAGKSEVATLVLRASREGDLITVEVTDDGWGSLVSDEGTGIGAIESVRAGLERIGGTLEVLADPAVGTTRRLTVPLMLATFQALTVDCAEQRYVLPQTSVLELVFIDGESTRIEYAADALIYRLRGNPLPVVRLDRTLGLTAGGDQGVYLVVLQAGGQSFGLVVDRVLNTEEVVVKTLHWRSRSIERYAGATILASGKVAPILDIASLARRARPSPWSEADTERETSAEAVSRQRVTDLIEVRREILAADPDFYNRLHDEPLIEA